ncbi:MAG: DUF2911 domain-containing protein [Pyrinomonadaceae bacterium]
MKTFVVIIAIFFTFCLSSIAQVSLPRESQKQSILQNVGDTTISIVYHRPNVKGRKVWGELVPYGEVWRSGANEATVFEVSKDVTINGKPLPAGKYSLHTIPSQKDWTIIFNKKWDQWGSFDYDEKLDALRVTATPAASDFRESLGYGVGDVGPTSAKIALRWERLSVPFTVDIGDIHGRIYPQLVKAIADRKTDDVRPLHQAANYVVQFKLKDHYTDALKWVETSIAARETFSNLGLKARLFNEQGKTKEAIVLAERAIGVGKSSQPPTNANALNALQEVVDGWKAQK